MALLSVRLTLPLRHFRLELSLEVGGVVALVGPSGAGKSTVLNAIAGLVRPASGHVALDDDVWYDGERGIFLTPDRRRVGLVFQEYALFPHMTVRQNVTYGGRQHADALLRRFGLSQLAAARPDQLSGGERQRVALARALARDPGVLLLDEPLSALDAHTKADVRDELAALLTQLGLPTLIVTHDYEDAIALADRLGVIVEGQLRQLGTPNELLTRPADAFVASLTGANLLLGQAHCRPTKLTEIALETGGRIYSTDQLTGAVTVAVHPWDITLSRDTGSAAQTQNEMRGAISSIVPLRGRIRIRVGPLTAELTQAAADGLELSTGDIALARFAPNATRLIARSVSEP